MSEYIAGLGLHGVLQNKPDLIGAEIGVNTGVTAEFLLKNLFIKRYYCVDPWQPYGIDNPSAGTTARTKEEADAHYKETLKRIEFAKDRVVIAMDSSENASKYVPDGELDFVFIDGDHSYEVVKQDLGLWWPKVKTGGIFSGHDFSHGDVNRALKEFLDGKVTSINLSVNDMWWAIKA